MVRFGRKAPQMEAGYSATVLVNLAARGVGEAFPAERIRAFLERQGVETRLEFPDSPAEMTRAASRAASRADRLLFVVGGDGTLRVAAEGIERSETALAALPRGTVNVWARETGIPRGLRAALDTHLTGRVVPMDLGVANGHRFLLMAGIGFDAAVTRDVSGALKRRIGDLAYVVQGARMLPAARGQVLRWSEGETVHEERLTVMVLSNTRLYGGRVRFSPGAFADDGLLDMVALAPHGPGAALRVSARLLLGRLQGDSAVRSALVPELLVDTPGLPVQIDGDYVGITPMRFGLKPGGLLVSIPAGPLPPILSGP